MTKVTSIIQGILILLVGISVLDFGLALGDLTGGDSFGFNDTLFEDTDSSWWNIFTFWAYGFLGVGIVQIVKGVQEE